MVDPLTAGGRRVKFGDVVRLVKESTKDPESLGLTRVVGLDHLDPGSLELCRWDELGALSGGTSFTRIFRRGQVLFGKRRAYQRKVAVADFDGICSGDILVFESSTDELLPGFLPYVVQSDGFFDHALGTSAGSLSPRTKWQDLAKYEFDLPGKAEQVDATELLRQASATAGSERGVARAAESAWTALLANAHERYDMRRVTLEQLCREPITYGIVQAGPMKTDGVPYIRVSDMTESEVLRHELLPRTSPEIAARYKRSACEPGDLVFALRGPIGLVRVVPAKLAGVNLTQGTARLSPDPTQVSTECLAWALRSPSIARQYRTLRKGSTFQELSLGALRRVEVDVPSVGDQDRFVAELDATARVQGAGTGAASAAEHLYVVLREILVGRRSDVQ